MRKFVDMGFGKTIDSRYIVPFLRPEEVFGGQPIAVRPRPMRERRPRIVAGQVSELHLGREE